MMYSKYGAKTWCRETPPTHNPAKRKNAYGQTEFYCKECGITLKPEQINLVLMEYLEEEENE